ncbi:MAG: LUD domain-containing protein [Deltaproteobacteria bacterium]|nr:LUD domain-containing protein [Deltaproteobacteria bacterium]
MMTTADPGLDALIARVRAALAAPPTPAPPLPVVPMLHAPLADPIATFIAAARAVGAEVLIDPPAEAIPPASATCVHTDAHVAIAVSGSVVLEGAPRLPSALCEHHVALVSRDRIVPTLADYLARETPARARVIITGPSKTADIEGILVTGVHGPARLTVVVQG